MITTYLQNITAKKTFIFLISFELFLVVMFLMNTFLYSPENTVYKLFNLDGERNIPALFSASQLALIGVTFLLKGIEVKLLQKTSIFLFLVAGVGFVFLGFDEAFSLHERITGNFQHIKWLPRFKNNHGLWVVPYLLVASLLLAATYRDILNLLRKYSYEVFLIILGMAIFVIGAVGLEIIAYQFLSETQSLYLLEVVLEEFFEMSGASFIFYGALQMLEDRAWAYARSRASTTTNYVRIIPKNGIKSPLAWHR